VEHCRRKHNSSVYEGQNIRGVAIAAGAKEVDDIRSADDYDFTSDYRRPRTGEFVVYENIHGNFCVIRILGVQSREYGAEVDYLKLHYAILPDGTLDFVHYSVG
jgi:hypothetical protein